MRVTSPLCALAVLGASQVFPASADDTTIAGILERAAVETSAIFDNCAVSIAFANATSAVQGVTGNTSLGGDIPATVEDKFVWGSLTKMLTGTAILRLVSEGKVTLDTPIGPIVDRAFAKIRANSPADAKFMNYSSMEELWGAKAANLSIRNVGKMLSGIPDFDTAKGSGKEMTDDLRATMYAEPTHFYGPMEVLSLPWVYTGKLDPVTSHSYSSTNFLLLGIILAELSGAATYEDYKQFSGFPADFVASLPDVEFGLSGCPADYTRIHGNDMTSYNGHNEKVPLDITHVDGVFSGWTASDLVGSPKDIAKLIFDIYGPNSPLLSPDLQEFMVPKANESFYGFATFNLSHRTGVPLPTGAAYGHLGATYGYQSIGAYFPGGGEFSLAVATNIETNYQPQPAVGMCKAFNMVRAFLRGEPIPTCEYISGSFYSSGCNCTVPPHATKP